MRLNKTVAILLGVLLLAPALLIAGGGQQAAPEQREIVLNWPTIWVGQDAKATVVEQLVNEFNQANAGQIRINMQPSPDYDGYRDLINTSIAAGQVPDLFVFNVDPTQFQYYDGDLLMDFTDDLKGPWGNRFVDGAIQASTRNGRVKSVPFESALTPIWYNTALFERAGISQFPTTNAGFWEAAEKLKAAGIVPMSHMTGGTNAWTSMLWYSHIVANIGGPDVWSKPLSDPVFVQAAEILLRMYQDGNTTRDAVGADAGVSGGHYQAQNTAMFINGPWYIGNIRTNSPEAYANTRLAAFPGPGNYQGGQIGFLLSNLAAANTNDPARRAAVIKFMQWMTEPANVARLSLDSGALFTIRFDIPPGTEVDPLQQMFLEINSSATFIAEHFQANFPADVVAEFGQALGSMALGRSTPQQFIAQIRAAAGQ